MYCKYNNRTSDSNKYSFYPIPNETNSPTGLSFCSNYTAPQGILLETVLKAGATLPNLSPIIFDTIFVNSSPYISYDATTGTVIFKKAGLYTVDWTINISGAALPSSIIFRFIQPDNTVLAQSINSNALPGEFIGIGLANIIAAPTTATLINASGDFVQFTNDAIQACLRIYS